MSGAAGPTAQYGTDRRPVSMQPEFELVRRAQRYESDALVELFDRHFDAVYRFAFARLGHARAAEEATAGGLNLALERLGSYREGGAGLLPWLYTQVNQAVAERVKSGQVPNGGGAAGRHRRALAELPIDQQHVLTLRFLGGLTTAEIAQVLGRREGSVVTLQHRALTALRDRIEAEAG